MNARCRLFLFVLASVICTPAIAQQRELVFPQVADGTFGDGSYYRSTFMVVPWSELPAACNLTFYGLQVAFEASPVAAVDFSVPAGGSRIFVSAGNKSAFQSGYATLACDQPVFGNLLYSYYNSAGVKSSEATVFGSPNSYRSRFVLDSRENARLGIAIANNTDVERTFTIRFAGEAGTGSGSVQIPPRRAAAQFVDEIMSIAAGSSGLLTIEAGDLTPFSAVGLRLTADKFTTIPVNTSPDATGTWTGDSTDSFAPGRITLNLTQKGATVTGTMSAATTSGLPLFTGNVSGTLTGVSLALTVAVPAGNVTGFPSCTATITGTASLSIGSMSGTYSGTTTCIGTLSNGRFTAGR